LANHKSAKKRAKQAIGRRQRNREGISETRTAIKKFRVAIGENQSQDIIKGLFVTAQAALARAGQRGLIHRNNAARKISRLSKLLVPKK
jgi:small subunit ribosomal protein S20